MKIIINKEGYEIISDIKEIGSIKGNNLLIAGLAKMLWEDPRNEGRSEKQLKESRELEFTHDMEKVFREFTEIISDIKGPRD